MLYSQKQRRQRDQRSLFFERINNFWNSLIELFRSLVSERVPTTDGGLPRRSMSLREMIMLMFGASAAAYCVYYVFQCINTSKPSDHIATTPQRKRPKQLRVMGFCTDHPTPIPPNFITKLAPLMFPVDTYILRYQPCSRKGFSLHPQSRNISLQERYQSGNVDDYKNSVWVEPDIYFCSTWYLDQQIKDKRRSALQKYPLVVDSSAIKHGQRIAAVHPLTIASHEETHYRPLIIPSHTEFTPASGNCNHCDVMMHGFHGWPAHKMPHCISVWSGGYLYDSRRTVNHSRSLIIPEDTDEYLKQILAIKERNQPRRWMLFMNNACFKAGYNHESVIRTIFFDMISEQQQSDHEIDALGGCRKDETAVALMERGRGEGHCMVGNAKKPPDGYSHYSDDYAVDCMLHYKFTINFENSWNDKGYWSEKLLNGLYAYSIPIYFGYDAIADIFNQHRFVNSRFEKVL